ncbi:HK97 family phage prohead protease [Mesorhizobium sp. NZP2298]|uniref:HK97 family phage prohead protease n=1 Tax=Mesorhizobium sp. NZP2298 TaxID=2483403 RepID=UPI001551B37E|nr:HK97 family phage prohead protease [Mesorhizobium sp. NZP2298]QKC97272.1 HK97 family phage prohead protease [Mesorhizobium sp. NZP2298]
MTGNVISGYAVMFNSETVIAGEFRERIAQGAFTRTLKDMPDVVAILSHDSGRVLGRVSAGTLTLREDRIGLWFSLDADPSTPEGQTAIGTVGRQDVKGCSFGFQVRAEDWQDGGNRLPLRTITDVDLYEITLTAFPAYESTSAALTRAEHNATAATERIRRRAEAAQRLRGIR